MPDIVFVSLEDWDDVWRRNQFVCAGLAKRFPGARILFVGLPRNVSHALRRGQWQDIQPSAPRPLPDTPNITVFQPAKLLPNSLGWGRQFNEWLARRQVRRAMQTLDITNPLLWLNPHSAVHMAGRLGERAIVYDITDDWITPTQSERARRRVIAQDDALCRRADAVIVCSQRLFEMKQPCARALFLIPNGVDVAHYQSVSSDAPPPPEAAHWTRPVLGYTGTLHPDRVDMALVDTLAQAFPHGTIALVGPNFLSPAQTETLRARGNIKLTGPVPYARVPDFMRAFDVCIVPHQMTPFTESLNPIKLWEYLAGGKPIVSTNIAGFRDYPQFVRLAFDTPAFVAACRDALAEGDDESNARRAEAGHHTWDARVEDIIAVLREITAPQAESNTYAA